MSFLTILAISISLAMDAFAVSVAVGTGSTKLKLRAVFRLSFHFGLFQFFMPILIVVLMLDLSFQFGVYTQEIVKFTSYMAEDGMYDETSSLFFKCRPELDDNYVKWNCNLQEQTSNKVYPDKFIPTKSDLNVSFYNQ